MRPTSASFDVRYGLLHDAKFFSNNFLRAGVRAYSKNLFFCQLSPRTKLMRTPFFAAPFMPAFLHFVRHIVRLITKKKMADINARRVVAAMQYVFIVRRTKIDLPCYAVRKARYAVCAPHYAVTMLVFSFAPFQTTVERRGIRGHKFVGVAQRRGHVIRSLLRAAVRDAVVPALR